MSKIYPGVYRITCQITGDCYVGSSAYLHNRKSEHLQMLRNNEHVNIHLQRAWNKYGENSFIFEVIEKTSRAKLIEREQYWIEILVPSYNIRKVAESNLGLKASEATREKHRQRWQNLSPEEKQQSLESLEKGRKRRDELVANGEWKHTPETIEVIKEKRANQKMSPAQLEILKRGQEIRKQVNPKPRLGMTNSEETRRKQSEAAKKRPPRDPEVTERIAAKLRNRKQSEESNRKRSETLKANKRVLTEEQKRQIAETNRATWAKKSAEEKSAIARKRYTTTN